MDPSSFHKYPIILMCLLLGSCSGLKHVASGDKLYTGAEIKLETNGELNKKERKFIAGVAKGAVRTKPNKSYFGMRPKLMIYHMAGDDPDTKIKKWLQKTGEAPVFISSIKPGATSAIIDAKIFNIGVFKAHTDFKVVEKDRTAKVIYTSHVHKPFIIKELLYAISDDSIGRIIQGKKEESVVKPGESYNLDLLKKERVRIDALLKDQGYFYFNPDFLLFKADTSAASHTVSLTLTLKDSVPANALMIYRIHTVLIDENYSLSTDASEIQKDTVRYQNTLFLTDAAGMNIRPVVILRSVYLKQGDIYSRKNHNITLNRLMSMGNFKFIQVKFSESDTVAKGFLNATILMTPLPKHSFRTEVEIVSKSNNYTGPRMSFSIQNKNTFKGAELLNINMAGSFEAQLGAKGKNLFSVSWNPQIELRLPMFLVPFKVKTNSLYIPRTRFLISYNYLKRVNYFDMSTFQFLYGYNWKKNIKIEHELNPINISYNSIANPSALFTELLISNPYLKKSYEEKFIAGGSYSFTYNEQVLSGKRIQFYFHMTSEVAGNAFSLAKNIFGDKVSSDNPSRIIGSVYSQFARISLDGRGYYNFSPKSKVAVRFFGGIGIPYGNSSTLPYIKQFFSGGPNSIRAYPINSVGPGTYHQETNNLGFLQLGGDIKLEVNAEYRFTIYRMIKGAIFVDTGNVWLLKSTLSEIASPFAFSRFADELAVGAGAGLRIDVSFFILRFDLGIPLRNPWLGEGNRWIINQMNFGNQAWRRENLILNIAIGYPF
ncbi:MAG: hypothetical protein A2X22_13890 [Bacteroidetes bacterium GWF2_49_14]|nr:MAG: hypothetical protein A2X22_13890 [Bacteroidetes bacterium GWF2_49_14]